MSREPSSTHPGEWLIGLLGGGLTLAAITYMAAQGVRDADAVPALSARLDEVVELDDGWLAVIEVRNDGDRTAAAVLVEGVLTGPDGPETSEATIDFVPGRGARGAGLLFASDPRAGTLALRPKGFEEP